MTLRQLAWMARGREASEWNQTGAIIEVIRGLFAKSPPDINRFIPPYLRAKKAAATAEADQESRAGWAGLKQAFKRGLVR